LRRYSGGVCTAVGIHEPSNLNEDFERVEYDEDVPIEGRLTGEEVQYDGCVHSVKALYG